MQCRDIRGSESHLFSLFTSQSKTGAASPNIQNDWSDTRNSRNSLFCLTDTEEKEEIEEKQKERLRYERIGDSDVNEMNQKMLVVVCLVSHQTHMGWD